MEHDPKIQQYLTSDPKSFAKESFETRWPVILTGAIDDVHKAVMRSDDAEARAEGKTIVEQLANLKYEVLHGRQLTPIPDDGFPDEVAAYNKEIEQRGTPSWFDTAWLFVECYMYRRISALFNLSTHWKSYDVFARQKIDTFRTSRNAVLELAARYKDLITDLSADKQATHDDEAEKLLFAEMFEICLWGNATDLSLLTSLTYEDIQKLQGAEARKKAENNILINDLPKAYAALKKAKDEGKQERRVDIVLDNAGFELYVDLILAGYLLSTGLATNVVIRPKSIPWFVSDVLPTDFSALLNALSDPRAFFETQSEDEKLQDKTPAPLSDAEEENLKFIFQHWAGLHAEGQLVMRPNRYWTAGGSYWRLPKEEPELFNDLMDAELTVFKGDLNYRKLTSDAHWDTTTPFVEAIGPWGPGSGINVLSLRTCKADVVVGLQPGQDEELKKVGGDTETGARKWAWHGKWAVVCFSGGKN